MLKTSSNRKAMITYPVFSYQKAKRMVNHKEKQTPIIEVKGLNVRTREGEILKNINLKIPRNKIVVLLGPSGCGKTTLLKSLNRLTDLHKELQVSGEVLID
jgi:phosphate transport system ATP-binding protein